MADEPASILLDRIRAERAAREPVKRRRAKKPSAVPNKIRINAR
jgi:hypothetical protein